MTGSVLGYTRPYLLADDVRDDAGVAVLASGGEEYEVGAGEFTEQLVAALDDLRDPDSVRWLDPDLTGLFGELDRLGLLRDAVETDAVAVAEADLATAVAEAAAWLAATGELVPADRFAAALAVLRGEPATPGNLYLDLLARQLAFWRRIAPLSVRAVTEVVHRLGGPAPASTPAAGGAYDVHNVRVHLDGLAALVALSCRDDAARICHAPATAGAALSGANFILDAEHATHAALRAFGTTRYHARLLGADVPVRLAEGTYIEQYHAARRYEDVITPLLNQRFHDALRDALYRYYAEEFGHEVYELKTCTDLGLDADAVRTAMPIPLWTAFLDVLSDLAGTEPVSLFACLIATEGMPSSKASVTDMFEERGLLAGIEADEHDHINDELDHITLARRLGRLLPSVTPEDQARAMDRLMLVIETGARGWNMVHDYYADPATPRCRGWLALPPSWYLR